MTQTTLIKWACCARTIGKRFASEATPYSQHKTISKYGYKVQTGHPCVIRNAKPYTLPFLPEQHIRGTPNTRSELTAFATAYWPQRNGIMNIVQIPNNKMPNDLRSTPYWPRLIACCFGDYHQRRNRNWSTKKWWSLPIHRELYDTGHSVEAICLLWFMRARTHTFTIS